jgi:nucleotide-binding universal stress UspA family protein
MFKQILVPLDGSRLAERALPVAAQLAHATHATLHLVRVVPVVATPWLEWGEELSDEIIEKITGTGMRTAANYLDTVNKRLVAQGITTRTARPTGNVTSNLLDYERNEGIDLMVMCTHGHSGLDRFVLGSISARLLSYGAAPVLMVHAFGPSAPLEHAVVPLDGLAEHENALQAVIALMPVMVHGVSLLRVIASADQQEEAARYLAAVSDRLVQQGIQVTERRVVVGDPLTEIRAMISAGQLVVMVAHTHVHLIRWFDTLVDDAVEHRAVDVLFMRSKKQG